jgi:hypothetical protein
VRVKYRARTAGVVLLLGLVSCGSPHPRSGPRPRRNRRPTPSYKAKKGAAFSLQEFHDSFIRLGPLPLPLIRKAMLGDTGTLS